MENFFNSLPDNLKQQFLRQNSQFLQSHLTQLFSQEMRKQQQAQQQQQQQQAQKPRVQQAQQLPKQTAQSLAAEQLYKNVAALQKAAAAPQKASPVPQKAAAVPQKVAQAVPQASTSKTATPPPQVSKPKSALSQKYKSLKEDIARDRETVRKVQNRNRVENPKAKEFFATRERMTEQQLQAVAEYCEMDANEIKKSRTDGIPVQRLWWKRFGDDSPPKGATGEDLTQSNFPLKSMDENLCTNTQLQLALAYLLSRNGGAIRGQAKDFEKKMREIDPRINETFLDVFDDSQPLMPHFTVTDELIHRHEEKLAVAKKKLADYEARNRHD